MMRDWSMREAVRPWKLATLAMGLGLLLWGSVYYQAPDWDLGICFVMAFFTYATAPHVLRTLLHTYRKPNRHTLAALFWWWFSVDGCYVLYHTAVGNSFDRAANFGASTALYFACGVIWLWNGSLRDLLAAIRRAKQAR